jgi:hypothetical protein
MLSYRIRSLEGGRRVLARAAFGTALAALLIGVNAGAVRAGDDDEDGASVIHRLMNSLGLKSSDDTIMGHGDNYSERSPLVVPPTRDLPPPVSDAAPPAPNWPKDPDVARRQAVKKVDDRAFYQRGDSVMENSRRLNPDELSQKSSTSNPGDGDYTADKLMVDPRDHGDKKGLFASFKDMFQKDQYGTFTGEPQRTSLTDPPPGYLTPSPDQPYGVGQAPASYKVKTLGERMEPTR